MTRTRLWQIRIGLLVLLTAIIWIAVWLFGSRPAYRSWKEIRDSGTLRAVTSLPVEQVQPQPELLTSQKEYAMLERFALDNGLELLVFRKRRDQLTEALLRDWADVAFAELGPGSNKSPRLTEISSGLGTVWWLPQPAANLKRNLEKFVRDKGDIFRPDAAIDDLPQIVEKRILRVLTLSTPPLYYIEQDDFHGFEYELVAGLADELELKLVVLTAPDRNVMLEWLREGRGDMAMADLPQPRPDPSSLIRKNFWERPDGKGILPSLENFDELTNPPAAQSDMEALSLLEITGLPKKYAWFFRQSSPGLKNAADGYISGFLGSELQDRYFGPGIRKFNGLKSQYRLELTPSGLRLSPFDRWIRKYAGEHGFDWLLIAAQIFQESRFRPRVVAADGGLGLMQLMPFTAREMGCERPLNPEQNIKAGTGYLAKLYNRLGDEIEPRDRLCFALASYNGGFGHLEDARILAGQLGLNRNRWQDNVENAYKLLERPEYYRKARYGSCRSGIIIRYVNEIMTRYLEYTQLNNDAPAKISSL